MEAVVVHHLNASRSHRVLWLLEELGVQYEIRSYARDSGMRAPADLKKIHPLGKAPVVTVGSAVLAESGAIFETLLDKFDSAGSLRPATGTPEFERFRYWMHFAEGSLMTPLIVKLLTTQIRRSPVPFFVRPIVKQVAAQVDRKFTDPEIESLLRFINSELEARSWFAGNAFTAADILMSFPLQGVATRAAAEPMVHRIKKFVTTLEERPAYKRATQRGGKLEILG